MVWLSVLGLLVASPVIVTALRIPPSSQQTAVKQSALGTASQLIPTGQYTKAAARPATVLSQPIPTIQPMNTSRTLIFSRTTSIGPPVQGTPALESVAALSDPSATSMTNADSQRTAINGPAADFPAVAANPAPNPAPTNASPVLNPLPTNVDPNSLNPNAPPFRNASSKPVSPHGAELGLVPNRNFDVPITLGFAILFLGGQIAHYMIHKANKKEEFKFHLSAMMVDFCTVRLVTCGTRIAWGFYPENVNLELISILFEFAGDDVIFAVNLFLTQRILRALHGFFGWNPVVNFAFNFLQLSVPVLIVVEIVVFVARFFYADLASIRILYFIHLGAAFWSVFLGFLPIPIILLAAWIPGRRPVEKFGTGRFRSKIVIVLYSSSVLLVGTTLDFVAAIITDTKENPSWFSSKPALYGATFALEITVVYLYLFARFDKRFHVPDNSKQAGDYANGYPEYRWNDRHSTRYSTNSNASTGFAKDTTGISGFSEKAIYRIPSIVLSPKSPTLRNDVYVPPQKVTGLAPPRPVRPKTYLIPGFVPQNVRQPQAGPPIPPALPADYYPQNAYGMR